MRGRGTRCPVMYRPTEITDTPISLATSARDFPAFCIHSSSVIAGDQYQKGLTSASLVTFMRLKHGDPVTAGGPMPIWNWTITPRLRDTGDDVAQPNPQSERGEGVEPV